MSCPQCQPQGSSSFSAGKEKPQSQFAGIQGYNWAQHSHLTGFPLNNPIGGLAAFRAFLKSEYSEENIEFWVSCEEYKKTKSPAKLSPKARKIYDEFISVQATKEVRAQNIPWTKAPP